MNRDDVRDIGTQKLINVLPVAASHQPGLLGKPDYGGGADNKGSRHILP
jgi:hypothetical protein